MSYEELMLYKLQLTERLTMVNFYLRQVQKATQKGITKQSIPLQEVAKQTVSSQEKSSEEV